MIKIKICGITNLEDALFASSEGVDAIGFIFTKKSPRYITKDKAKNIIKKLPPFLTKAGVFLDQDKKKVLKEALSLGLDVLQFHGREPPSYCDFFRPKFKVIKAFFPEDKPYKSNVARFAVDALLFDIRYDKKIEGEKTLPFNTLRDISKLISLGKRVIISGGLNTKNINRIKKFKPYAVDVASGIEKSIGKKDKRLMSLFIAKVKQ